MQKKLFIGTRLTHELRGDPAFFSGLKQISHEGKEYIGLFLESPHVSLAEIKNHSSLLTAQLHAYFPNLRASQITIVVFPKLLLG